MCISAKKVRSTRRRWLIGCRKSWGVQLKESAIVAKILKYLKARPHCFAWKTHGGPYGSAGIPDVITCVDGRFVALEVKQPMGKLTELQKVTLEKIRAAGGVAEKVTSLEEVLNILKTLQEDITI